MVGAVLNCLHGNEAICMWLQLEELAITGEEHVHPKSWAIALVAITVS